MGNTPKFNIMMFPELLGALSGLFGLGMGVVAWIFFVLEPFGVLGPNDGNKIYEDASNDFDNELKDQKMEEAQRIADAITAEYPDKPADVDLVFEKLMGPSDTAALRKEQGLEALIDSFVKKEGAPA